MHARAVKRAGQGFGLMPDDLTSLLRVELNKRGNGASWFNMPILSDIWRVRLVLPAFRVGMYAAQDLHAWLRIGCVDLRRFLVREGLIGSNELTQVIRSMLDPARQPIAETVKHEWALLCSGVKTSFIQYLPPELHGYASELAAYFAQLRKQELAMPHDTVTTT